MKGSIELRHQAEEIRAKQREITAKDDLSASDREQLWTLEGQASAIEAQANEVAECEAAELSAARSAAVKTPEIPATGVFRAMPKGIDLEIRAALLAGSGSGAYLVGQEWHDQVEKLRYEKVFLRAQGARVISTASTHNIPVLSGIPVADIVAENTAYTAADPTIAPVVLGAYKMTIKTLVGEELLQDSAYNVDDELARAVGWGFARAEERYYLVGTGTGQPTGIFAKTADQTFTDGTAITKDELIDVVYGLPREFRDGACWMMNDSTAAYIAKMKLDVQTSGTLVYFWQDPINGEQPKLLGYPVFTNSHIAAIAPAAKTIAFGNPQMYAIGERGPMVAKRLSLNEYGDTYAFSHRIDGKPLSTSAFYVAKQAA